MRIAQDSEGAQERARMGDDGPQSVFCGPRPQIGPRRQGEGSKSRFAGSWRRGRQFNRCRGLSRWRRSFEEIDEGSPAPTARRDAVALIHARRESGRIDGRRGNRRACARVLFPVAAFRVEQISKRSHLQRCKVRLLGGVAHGHLSTATATVACSRAPPVSPVALTDCSPPGSD